VRRRLATIAPAWRAFVIAMLLPSLLLGHAVQAQPADLDLPDGALGEQVQWLIDVADGDVDLTDPAEGLAHFTPGYLDDVDMDELVTMVQLMLARYAPVTPVSVTETEPGESAQIVFEGADGTLLAVDLVIETDTGLIAGLTIHEHALDDAGASPAASPAADIAVPVYADIEAEYTENVETLRGIGTGTVALLTAGDYESVAASFSPDLQGQADATTIEQAVALHTTNRVHLEIRDLGVIMDGYREGDVITGYFSQRGAVDTFTLTAASGDDATPAATPVADGVPAGTWSGKLDALGLGFEVTFGGDASNLTATFSSPEQQLYDKAMNAVSFEAERPIGEQTDESVIANGGVSNGYRAKFAWGPGSLVISISIAPDGTLTGLQMTPEWALSPDPAVTSIEIAPMFDGAWEVVWGGDTEFTNYHAVTPPQRHAYDLVVWKDGATFTGDGLENEDYHAFGQTLYAPVAGEVVAVESTLPDLPPLLAQISDPALAKDTAASPQSPVGNHVVIRTEDGLFVYLAHMQEGSATVDVGDTVDAGDAIGKVGNTGNTSEPHIHVHVQTTQAYDDAAALGIPVTWVGTAVNGDVTDAAKPEQGDIIEPAG
jgi:hypothetical protein